jgi:hypothetical protein
MRLPLANPVSPSDIASDVLRATLHAKYGAA